MLFCNRKSPRDAFLGVLGAKLLAYRDALEAAAKSGDLRALARAEGMRAGVLEYAEYFVDRVAKGEISPVRLKKWEGRI